ncbi:MAG: hypothetical protein HZB26_21875 [Candidatus Hydrogenedentes bacterium]|nr:hypothetical protein [Candidatus Hydrogenedentota bacterium]
MLLHVTIFGIVVMTLAASTSAVAAESKPVITKLGAIDCDMVETTPVVFNGKLYRFEYVRDNYKPNTTGKPYFRFVDVATGDTTPPFAEGFCLGSAYVEEGTVYVYGIKGWGTSSIAVFWSTDMKTWKTQTALAVEGWGIYNTSVCKGSDGYVLAIELGEPPAEVGVRFTMRFASSKDLLNWTPTKPECVYSKDRYTACPALRYLDGYYYMVYLEAYPGPEYAPHIVRSKDLITWTSSPFNPIMKHDDQDKRIANPKLTPEQRKRIQSAKNINNSDVDFCEFQGKTYIYYSWGDQQGNEFFAEARFDGSQAAFLKGFFPESPEPK